MRTVVGLGNPGAAYVGTRHNVGFDAVDELARRSRAAFQSQRGCDLVEARQGGVPFLLVKPTTFMNRSGEPLRAIVAQRSLVLEEVLVVVDDFHLDLGRLRMRAEGSHGGHNGLRSIVACLGSAFPRLRLGIGPLPLAIPVEDFVLSRFRPTERAEVADMVARAAEAAADWVQGGPIEDLMSRYNGRA